MRIQTTRNFKLKNRPLMVKGIYDDIEKPFPKEIYEEIDIVRQKKTVKPKLIILVEDEPKKRRAVIQPQEPVINTLETEDEVIDTKEEVEPEPEVKKVTRKRKK